MKPRPGPLRWLWYAVGGGLPERFHAWVLHDTTCSTWVLRHFVRSLLLLAIPVALVVFLLPADTGLTVLIAGTAGGCGLLFMMVHVIETTERRAIRAGQVGGTAERLRGERAASAQRLANAARRERTAARAARGRR